MFYQTSPAYRFKKPGDYSFDVGPMGAIGEQGSLMLRVNRNCPWGRCLFCGAYKDRRFEYRSPEEIKGDVAVVETLSHELRAASGEIGMGGEITRGVVEAIVLGNPEIYGDHVDPGALKSRLASLNNVARWLSYGGKSVFLQDANAIIMRTPELVDVIGYLKKKFPGIGMITSYARSKTCAQKSAEELKALSQVGLSRLLVGLESGYDPVLEYMQKGVTAEGHIRGGRNVVEAGMYLVEFVMPGLGGRRYWERHALETARVLNEIKPNLIRLRSLAIQESSPLYERWKAGEFEQPTDDQMVDEIGLLIENLNCDCAIETGQLTNILFEIKGKLPADKEEILQIIEWYRALPLMERLRFRLDRYAGNYLPYVRARGKSDAQLEQLFEEAWGSLEEGSPQAEAKVDQAITAMKGRYIP